MERYCEQLDRGGQEGYLETDWAENVAFYARFGFETAAEIPVLGVRDYLMPRKERPTFPAIPRLRSAWRVRGGLVAALGSAGRTRPAAVVRESETTVFLKDVRGNLRSLLMDPCRAPAARIEQGDVSGGALRATFRLTADARGV